MPNPVTPRSLSRRTLLRSAVVAGAGLGLAPALAGCGGSSATSGSKAADLMFLEPGDVPPGWDAVKAAVNTKLTKDTGLTFDVQWIGWSNYAQQELLKYTSGEKFTGSLEASWLHIGKLSQDKSIAGLGAALTAKTYPNLYKTLNPLTIKTSKIDGDLYGIPQVNNASYVLGFMVRQDLASGEIETFEQLERYLYGVKQKKPSMIPYGCDNGYVNDTQDMFNQQAWDSGVDYLAVRLSNNFPLLYISVKDAQAGNARIVPVWEVPEIVAAFRRIRTYYNDGIINHDIPSLDKATADSLFGSGKYASMVGTTDGLETSTYGAVRKQVPGAQLAQVVPFGPHAAKPFSEFGAGNQMSINVRSNQLDAALKFQDWCSIQENHDLLELGVEGKDWKAVGDKEFTPLSQYNFPGYTMCWRVPLERTPTDMVETERKWFGWAQKFDSFRLSPLAGFTTNEQPIKTQIASLSAAANRFLQPLQAGSGDTDKSLNAAKSGFTAAGLDKAMTEIESQLTTFFKKRG